MPGHIGIAELINNQIAGMLVTGGEVQNTLPQRDAIR